MFLDINENQKPVSPDLVWDLRGTLTPKEPKGIISRIVKELDVIPYYHLLQLRIVCSLVLKILACYLNFYQSLIPHQTFLKIRLDPQPTKAANKTAKIPYKVE